MSKKKDKIGVGIITCNRPDYLQNLLETLVPCIDNIDSLVVINDGEAIDNIPIGVLLNNDVNIGGKTFLPICWFLDDF